MPTFTMSVRPSSDLSDSEYEGDEDNDFQDEEEDQFSEEESHHRPQRSGVTLKLKNGGKNSTIVNGRSQSANASAYPTSEIILCESKPVKTVGRPKRVVEKDPLEIDDDDLVDDDDEDNDVVEVSEDDEEEESPKRRQNNSKVPALKINRIAAAGETSSWSVDRQKTKSDVSVRSKRGRPKRSTVTYVDLDDDDDDDGSPPPKPQRKSSGRPAKASTAFATPQPPSRSRSAPQSAPPASGRRGRRKRKDSGDDDDSFEILPFKRRKFRHEDVDNEDANDATPSTPRGGRPSKRVEEGEIIDVDDSTQDSNSKMSTGSPSKTVDEESMSNAEFKFNNGGTSSTTKKRGRPKKSEQAKKFVDIEDNTDSLSTRRHLRRRTDTSHDENSRMSFGDYDDSSILDLLDADFDRTFGDDSVKSSPKKTRPGPVKHSGDRIFPRLTADELESARESGWQCKVCGRKLANQWSLDTHFTTVHGQRTFSCDICGKAFKRKDHLINHKRSIHLVRNKDCRLCDLSFKRKTELVAHMKTQHPRSVISTTEVRPGDEIYMDDSSPKKRGRKKKSFEEERFGNEDLEMLLLTGEKSSSKRQSLDDSFDSLDGKKKRGRPRKVCFEDKDSHRRCPECHKVFQKAVQVPIHMKAWHEPYPCQFCSSVCVGSERLERHLAEHKVVLDDGTLVFICTQCQGRFHKESGLRLHARDYHREEHCLACGSCVKGSFLMRLHVAEHHTPERILRDERGGRRGGSAAIELMPEVYFQCVACPRAYYDVWEAERHFITRHVTQGDCGAQEVAVSGSERRKKSWWPWLQLYPKLDIYADNYNYEWDMRKLREEIKQKELAAAAAKAAMAPPLPICRKTVVTINPAQMLFDAELEEIRYQCELCEDLFEEQDLLEEHLGIAHMATCLDYPDLFPFDWDRDIRLRAAAKEAADRQLSASSNESAIKPEETSSKSETENPEKVSCVKSSDVPEETMSESETCVSKEVLVNSHGKRNEISCISSSDVIESKCLIQDKTKSNSQGDAECANGSCNSVTDKTNNHDPVFQTCLQSDLTRTPFDSTPEKIVTAVSGDAIVQSPCKNNHVTSENSETSAVNCNQMVTGARVNGDTTKDSSIESVIPASQLTQLPASKIGSEKSLESPAATNGIGIHTAANSC